MNNELSLLKAQRDYCVEKLRFIRDFGRFKEQAPALEQMLRDVIEKLQKIKDTKE